MKLGFESALDKRALKRNTSGFFLKQIAQNGLRSTTYQYLTSKTHKIFLLLHLFFPFIFFFFFFFPFLSDVHVWNETFSHKHDVEFFNEITYRNT